MTSDFMDMNLRNMFFLIGNSSAGKINFTERIDLVPVNSSGCFRVLDMDSHVNISHNMIELDSDGLPELNRNATLTLFNLTFNIPVIIRDGERCPSSTCCVIILQMRLLFAGMVRYLQLVVCVQGHFIMSATAVIMSIRQSSVPLSHLDPGRVQDQVLVHHRQNVQIIQQKQDAKPMSVIGMTAVATQHHYPRQMVMPVMCLP